MVDEWAVRQPHPALRPFISRYIGYRRHEVTPRVHRGLPSRYATLVISLEQPVRMARVDQPGRGLQALVGGIHLAPMLIEQDRSQTGLHLQLNPLGTRMLLGFPAAELSGVVADLADLGSPGLVALPDRLAATNSWRRRFAILDEVFLAHLAAVAPARASPPEVGQAWRRLLTAGGGVRVGALAEEVGWSGRHLTERFRRELGLTPKQAARVLRFERAGALLRQHGPGDLAGVAVACGYYDQAHLSNEWRALAGCSPGTWIAEELPALQDLAGTADEKYQGT
ncbi:AraC family transcriptional regulator [Amycolatopsis palatopharyngis]|uniref:AraC family transcriptional regulator n=1 Tax=Amycolatopsis palatopharyngis TaxID=187982 RepID=UPI000E247CDA|nr:helix-turn-helix domain-containing protein [Amycolatopsis palatopharyngis]